MTVLIRDEFTGMTSGQDIGGRTPSPTNTPGNTWLEDAANTIESDGSGGITSASSFKSAQIGAGASEISVELDFNAGGNDERGAVFIADGAFRASGGLVDHGYTYNFLDTVETFGRTDAGSGTTLQSNSFTRNRSTTYNYRIERRTGGLFKCFRDNVEITGLAGTDTTYTALTFGGLAQFKFVAGGTYDNFEIVDLAAGGIEILRRRMEGHA